MRRERREKIASLKNNYMHSITHNLKSSYKEQMEKQKYVVALRRIDETEKEVREKRERFQLSHKLMSDME